LLASRFRGELRKHAIETNAHFDVVTEDPQFRLSSFHYNNAVLFHL